MILFVGQYGDDSVDAQREGCLGNCTKIGGKFQSSEAGISINQLSGEKEKKKREGLPWWSSVQDFTIPMQGAWVPSLVRELDPTYRN